MCMWAIGMHLTSFLKYIYCLNVPTRAAFIFIAGLCLDVSWSIDRAMSSTVLWRRVVAFTVSAPLCTSTGLRALLPIIKIFPAAIYCKFSSQNLNNKPKMAVTNIKWWWEYWYWTILQLTSTIVRVARFAQRTFSLARSAIGLFHFFSSELCFNAPSAFFWTYTTCPFIPFAVDRN